MESEHSEVELVQSGTPEQAAVNVGNTVKEESEVSMLQLARNEFYKNRKIVIKHIREVTEEVSN